MTGLLEACLRIPTVIFTVGLGIVMLYWLFVLVGALDIDLFGGDASGAAKGLGDAFAGAKGVGDVLAGGGDGLGGVGEALAGSGDGAGDALGGDGGTDAVKADAGHAAGGGFWDALGLATVPITISFSIVVVVSWALSILGMYYGGKLLGPDSILLALGVFVATVVVGIPLAGLVVRPLNPVFKLRTGKTNRDYLGAICSITTGQVTSNFGQATIEDGGTVLVIAVVCDKPEALKRGDRALIIEFDTARHAYVVEPLNEPALLP